MHSKDSVCINGRECLSHRETPSTKQAFYADRSNKPVVPPPAWDSIPAALRDAPRCILGRLEWRDDGDGTGHWSKVPYQTNGRKAKSNDPQTWTDFGTVRAAYGCGRYDGIGFVLGGGFVGVDLDNVADAGELDPAADDLV